MSERFLPPRGTSDIYDEDERRFRFVTDAAMHAARCACFQTLHTPVFESARVFARGLGEASDIVHKEMYLFEDRGGEPLTLRPEFTAGVARAFIAGGFHQKLPVKFFSTGPLFRYERPQKGRRRQFHQINYECYGYMKPESDADMILLASDILSSLRLQGSIAVEINTLGDSDSRFRYKQELISYLLDYKNDLSEDSRRRLESNPLRILDSKNEGDKLIVADAPELYDSLSQKSVEFFARVRECLDTAGLVYAVNPKLVRGLDYYNDTVFEFTTDGLGAQNTILAGGRYDGLTQLAGGPVVPAVGFAAGIERLAALLTDIPEDVPPVLAVSIGDAALPYLSRIIRELRAAGIPVDHAGEGNPKKQFKLADKRRASFVIIAGDDEIAAATVKIKNMTAGIEEIHTLPRARKVLADAYSV